MAAGNLAMSLMMNRVLPLLQMLSYPTLLLSLTYIAPKLWAYRYCFRSVSLIHSLDNFTPYKNLLAMPWLVNMNRDEMPR